MSGDFTGVRWDYWCPPEGEYVMHPNELHVGLFSDVDGCGVLLWRVAVIPPMSDLEGWQSQADCLARIVRDAIATADIAEWVRANKGYRFPLPPVES